MRNSFTAGCIAALAFTIAPTTAEASWPQLPTEAEACPGTTMIGKAPGGVCPNPDPERWVVSNVFTGSFATNPDLNEYCKYSYHPQPPDPTDPESEADPELPGIDQKATLLGPGGVAWHTWLHEDCDAVAPLSTYADIHDANWPTYFNTLQQQLEMPPVPTASMLDPRDPVEIAILDSQPPGGVAAPNKHGAVVERVINLAACEVVYGTGSICPNFTVRHHLALNKTSATGDASQGGHFGELSRLAEMLEEAVDSAASGVPLVINLSVGWDTKWNDKGSGARHAAEMVFEALEEAASSGALVIVAAGNSSWGDGYSTGPMAPAVWESRIGSLYGTSAGFIQSVGGVDGADRPLVNGREDGRPPLAAIGHGLMTYSLVGPTEKWEPLTGTSLAAAVTSGVAALTWALDSTKSAAEIRSTLYTTAVPLTETSDYSSAGASVGQTIKRVSLCAAAFGTDCLSYPAYSGSNAGWAPAATSIFESSGFTVWPLAGLEPMTFACGDVMVDLAMPPPDFDVCIPEMRTNSSSAPSVDPQPTPDPCGACNLMVSYDMLDILVEPTGPDQNPRTLRLIDMATETVVARFDISALGTIAAGSTHRVYLPPLGGYAFDLATIEWGPTGFRGGEGSAAISIVP